MGATEAGSSGLEGEMMRRTVAVVDMVGYSSIAKLLEENISAASVAELNRQIQTFMTRSLAQVADRATYSVVARTGDGIILMFERVLDAHCFAIHVHGFAKEHNAQRSESTAQRWFRVGIATGEVSRHACSSEPAEYAGIAIANAVRLESAAAPGEVVIDATSYEELPDEIKRLYGPEERVRGKREERFRARRYCVTPKPSSRMNVKLLVPRTQRQVSRRVVLGAGGALAAGLGLSAWLEWPELERWLHPMPRKRFVALMAWPRASGEAAPLVSGALQTIHTRLSRAETSVRDLLVVAADDVGGEESGENAKRHQSPNEVADAWNANLILAAHVVERTGGSAASLVLQVMDAAAMKVLRTKRIGLSLENPRDLYREAADASALLLDLPSKEIQLSDDAELASLSPAVRRVFEEARLLAAEPNGSKSTEAIERYQQVLVADPQLRWRMRSWETCMW
jgi:class 3 adenylate cyclase